MRSKLLIVAVVLAAAPVPALAQSVTAGIEAWQHSDYAGAVAIWRPLAEKGDADAAFNLGQAYRLGRGVPINLGAAQGWFERAARKGHVDAQTTLGLMLFQNGNQTGGLRWLKDAAEQGEPRALLIYGTALFNGDGVPRDPLLGYAYVSRAAAQGLAPAKDTLAQLDSVMSLEDRKKGVALAIAKSKQAPPPGSKRNAAVAKPLPAPARPPQLKTAQAPAKPAVPVPQTRQASSGGWRIQLGAFSQRASAEALYRKMSGSLGGRQAFYIPVGNITRLQVGPYASKTAAQAACSALKQPCFPVAAN